VVGEFLKTNTVTVQETCGHLSLEFSHGVGGETEFTGDENLLTAGELETSSVHGFIGVFNELGLGSHGDEDLVDCNTGGLDVGLTEGTSHTLLESISTSAGQHLVDTNGVPGVRSDTQMETVFSGVGNHVFVGSNTG